MPLYFPSLPFRTRLVGVATSRMATAEHAKELLGFERATADSLSLIESDDVDIVHICTPNDQHLPALLAAMKAGKHIYCDKPLTATLAEAEQVAALLPSYKATSQMALQYRFWPATLRAKQLIDEGRVGAVSHFRGAYLHSGSVDRQRPLNWKANADRGGGVLNDLGSHIIDLLQHLLGPLEPVYATRRVWSNQRRDAADASRSIAHVAEDFAMVTMRTADGTPGIIEASKIATGSEDELRFEIHGEKGALRFNLMDANWLEFYDQTDVDSPFGGNRGWKRIATVARYDAMMQALASDSTTQAASSKQQSESLQGSGGPWPSPKNHIGWLHGHTCCLYNFLAAIARGEPGDPSLAVGIELQRKLAKIAAMMS